MSPCAVALACRAPLRFVRRAPSRFVRRAPLRFVRRTPLRSAPLRFAPLRFAPLRFAPLRFAPLQVAIRGRFGRRFSVGLGTIPGVISSALSVVSSTSLGCFEGYFERYL